MLSIYRKYFLFSFIFLVSNLFTFTTAFCNPNPCVHGECEQLGNTHVCHCPPNIKGDRCNLLLQPGEDPCLRKPCWNAGTCKRSGSEWTCDCKTGFSGIDCRFIDEQRSLKVKNLGWYTSYVELRYKHNGVSKVEGVVIFGLGGQHTFRYSKNSIDVWLVADAVGGKRFYNVPIDTTPDTRCYHLWGNVFDPKGTPMTCNQF